MATILDLPDDCLINICKKLDNFDQQYPWEKVCKRFQYIYYEYLHNKTEVNDSLVKDFGHLIGTEDFPIREIKKLNLTLNKCTNLFLNKLRDSHPEVEEAALFDFTDEHMAELLPLPNLKVLTITGFHMRGSSLINLGTLTELRIVHSQLIFAENLLLITYHNPLRVFVTRDPRVFSERYAFQMVENLKLLEELEVKYNPCKSWQLIGTLPLLKKLNILIFKADPGFYETCATNRHKILFDELRKKNQLVELIFKCGKLNESDLNGIADLKSLRILKFFVTDLPQNISLDIFKDLVNLEELQLNSDTKIVAEESLEFIRNCQKLRRIDFWNTIGINENFILKANDMISQWKPPPLEPITFVLLLVDQTEYEKGVILKKFCKCKAGFNIRLKLQQHHRELLMHKENFITLAA